MPPSPDDRLNKIQDEIHQARVDSGLETPTKPTHSNASERAGMRAGSELIGGILGGLMFGYFADAMFNTRPYGLVLGLLLGVAAGFYGAYRYSQATK